MSSGIQTHCVDCDHTFLLTPDGATQSVACPSCGGNRLERDQPSPTNSDGDLRNVPTPSDGGIGLDQGGNPLQEGIWATTDGGWQPFRRRDESFASVKKTAVTVTPHPSGGIHNGPLALLSALKSVQINGVPVTPENRNAIYAEHGGPNKPPVEVTAHHPAFEQLAARIIEDGHGYPQEYKDDVQALQEGIRAGQIPPPTAPGAPPVQASRVSFEDFDFGIDFDKTPVKKFIVDQHGRVMSGDASGTHEDIANQHRIQDFPKGHSLGTLHGDGSTEWYQHETPHSPQALESMLYGHFGTPVQIDPNLKPTTNEERWGLVPGGGAVPRGNRELGILEGAPQPRSYVPLDRNEGLVRGGRTLNMDPYLPWTHEAEVKKESFLPALLGLLGAGGAAAGAEGITGGALVGGLMRGALLGAGSNAVKGLGGGGSGQPEMGPQSVPPPRPAEALSHVTADIETPHTNPGYHDTEDGDTKQFDDESTDPAQQNPHFPGGAGGAAQGEDNVDGGIGANQPNFSSGTLEKAKLLLPLILNYYNSEESGAADPQIQALHEQLEAEHPGYLDTADDEAVGQFMQKLREPSAVAASVVISSLREAFDWNTAPDTADVRPQGVQAEGQCAYCGGQTDPSGTCTTCGAQAPTNPQAVQQQAQQPSVPPFNPQQSVAPPSFTPMPGYTGAVTDQGHCHHCGAVTTAGGTCPQCGAASPSVENQGVQAPNIQAKVAADHQGPVTDEQKKAVAELLIQAGRHEEIPHMLEAPWDYSEELAQITQQQNVVPNVDPNEQPPPQPVQEIAPPGATMPVPNPADPSMQGQMISRVADHAENAIGVPAADQQEQPDVEQNQDSSHSWQDDSGQPLVEGQTYELHSPKYAIPDIVQIEALKPDGIVLKTVAEQNPDPQGQDFAYSHEITKQEADLEGYTFTPSTGQEPEPTPEQAQDSGEPAPVNTEPVEQPEVPHQLSHVEDPDPDEYCPRCSTTHITSSMSSPTTVFHECYRCSHVWETKEEDYIDHNTAGREWIREDSGPGGDDFFAEYERIRGGKEAAGSRNIADIAARDPRYQEIKHTLEANAQERTAGKRFTPSEQRTLIDESGVARNADKLDLDGTHYESHRYLGDKANGMNAPDEHLFMGW